MHDLPSKYVYPAIFDYAEDGISVAFPDLPGCFTCGSNDMEALDMAKEALGLHLWSMEEDGEEIPEPSAPLAVPHEGNQIVCLVEVWMPPIRSRLTSRSTKTTVTLPQWLKDKADEHQVNYSQLLQNAIKTHLGLDDTPRG